MTMALVLMQNRHLPIIIKHLVLMDVADNEAYRMKMHRPMECEVMCLPRSKGGATGSMVVTLVVAMLSSEECLGSYYNE